MSSAIKQQVRPNVQKLRLPWESAAVIGVFSMVYLAGILPRAGAKFFWYDELFTVFFSSLPDFAALWRALTSGIDFNPPAFYILTRLSRELFGAGLVGTRVPEIAGFWIFSISLYCFVRKQNGYLPAIAALLFPSLTSAYFYAYEARPHGVVLGFCGLALLSWQKAVSEARDQTWGPIALAASLLGAFEMHCFALTLVVPFVVTEAAWTFHYRRFRKAIWGALLTPVLLACLSYVSLVHSYRGLASHTDFGNVSPAGWTHVDDFFGSLFQNQTIVLTATLAIFAAAAWRWRPQVVNSFREANEQARYELLLAAGFAFYPAYGVLLAKLTSAPYFGRYSMPTVAGLALLVGLSAAFLPPVRSRWFREPQPVFSTALAALLATGIAIETGRYGQLRLRGQGELLIESSSQMKLETTPHDPLHGHSLLTRVEKQTPLAILSSVEFLYLVEYAPALRSQMTPVFASPMNAGYVGFPRLLEVCPAVHFQPPQTFATFAQGHREFAAYGNSANFNDVGLLAHFGVSIESLSVEGGHFLAYLKH